MLEAKYLFKLIDVYSPKGDIVRPRTLEELGDLQDHDWIWKGKHTKGYPQYKGKSAIHVLHDYYRFNIRKKWRLEYPPNHNRLDVNPFKVKMCNGYFYDRTPLEIYELIDLIPEMELSNKSPEEIYNALHKCYPLTDITKALKLLLPQTI